VLIVAVLLVMGTMSSVVIANVAGAAPSMDRESRLAPPRPPRGAVSLGGISRSQSISLEVVLAPSHQAQMASLLRSVYAVGSPDYHQWMPRGEFARRFDPSPAEVAAVESWLAREGLHPTYTSGLAVHVSGPAGLIESGLGLSFNEYRLAGGRQVRVATAAPLVPSNVSGTLVSVLGLDNAPRLTSHIVQDHSQLNATPVPHAEGLSPCVVAPPGADTPDAVGAAYGIGSLTSVGQNGTGQQVAVYELAPHVAGDISTFETCFGLHNLVSTVAVDGGGSAGGGTAEADADIEQIATQSPGATIVSYEGPNTTQGSYDVWSEIVNQDTASVVSTSYGLCEPDSVAAGVVTLEDALFSQAALQGQTILAASGDSGAEDCYPPSGNLDTSLQADFPASDPSVTAVGGTTLSSNGTQAAWNDCEGQTGASCANLGNLAGGGGISRYETRPNWQPAEWEWGPGNACGTNCRNEPDISANAGTPEAFYVQGNWGLYVGTSIAAPLVAGLVSDTAEGCLSARRGVIAQSLYGLAGDGDYGTALTDVTTGDNDLTRTYGGQFFPTSPGYDPSTGLGTPIASGWSCPEVSSVSPAEAQPGSEVTIGGLGLETATILFGGQTANVLSASATSATVFVPTGSGTVTVSSTSLMGAGTTTRLFTYTPPSSPPPAVVPASSSGYDLVGQDGGVFVFPTNQSGGFYGSIPGLGIHVQDITGMVPSPDDGGYFLVGQDGGVFSFGDAPFLGSLPGIHVPVHDIKGIVPTRDNRGYFLVGQDGGVFSFGDAPFLGSLPGEGIRVNDVVGLAATPSGQGYWVVGGNGAVYAFGNAANLGSVTGNVSPVTGITSTPDGGGYWIVTQDGSVYDFGDAGSFGSLTSVGVSPTSPVIGLVPTADDRGYWLVGSDGGIFAFGDAPFVGSLPGLGIHVTNVVGAVPTTL
jgi:subtilase family serine protease